MLWKWILSLFYNLVGILFQCDQVPLDMNEGAKYKVRGNVTLVDLVIDDEKGILDLAHWWHLIWKHISQVPQYNQGTQGSRES